jgi:hypothetical protein
MQGKSLLGSILGWVSGILFSAIGVVNIFWGNDPVFGVFILALSLVYYPPSHTLISKLTGYSIPLALKIGLAIFILWASLGVGELFDKIDMMMQSF